MTKPKLADDEAATVERVKADQQGMRDLARTEADNYARSHAPTGDQGPKE